MVSNTTRQSATAADTRLVVSGIGLFAAVTNIAIAAGTKVSERSIAVVSASITVIAIGWKVLPSIPDSAKIGR